MSDGAPTSRAPGDKNEPARLACIAHAADLVSAAELLASNGFPHLSFHLSTLALEEVGKAVLLRLAAEGDDDDEGPPFVKRGLDDHVRKLFFAIWSITFGREVITKEQIEEYQGLAQRIHDYRLQGLYVETGTKSVTQPKDAISVQRAESHLRLAKARLEMEQNSEYRELEPEDQALVDWFIRATSNSEKRGMIFGARSMSKLAELGSSPKWMAWLKEEFDRADRESLEIAKRELERQQPSGDAAARHKWKMKVRLRFHSHSIRPKELNEWNGFCEWIRLHPAGTQKNELVAEFLLPAGVSIHALWYAGFGAANQFLVALNISTMGLCWWHGPHCTDRFYDQMEDLDNPGKMEVKRSPTLEIDWGRRVLTANDLRTAALCIGGFPNPNKPERSGLFNHYLTGLALLGKTDVFMQFEYEAFEQFLTALREGMQIYGDWDGVAPFHERLKEFLAAMVKDEDEAERFAGYAAALQARTLSRQSITLSEACAMKIFADGYFIKTFRRLAAAPPTDAPVDAEPAN
ncbi:MAG TPA: AbiV family abortive infection protein [Phycisphaerales bacterium]|nr:AbiV family abortive infection protein [Phycisphaerales bacterium]